MWALGEFITYMIYFLLGLSCAVFLIFAVTVKKRQSKLYASGLGIFFGFLLLSFKFYQDRNYKDSQLTQVGIYYLTNYPDCDSCYIELNENMTYQILNKSQTVEKGDWHYEVGGDYWITYLNSDKGQLGNGKYSYRNYQLKYSTQK
jgi:hypothetical protein